MKGKSLGYYFLLMTIFAIPVMSKAQKISGKVINEESEALSYVNIGIKGTVLGTVSDAMGNFTLIIDEEFYDDEVTFSIIGYESEKIKVNDLLGQKEIIVSLRESIYMMPEIEVKAMKLKAKLLGNSTENKMVQIGFEENRLGYEVGMMMKVKKSAFIEKLHINIASCSYDSIFYRVNVYQKSNDDWASVLKSPIYLSYAKEELGEKLSVDLKAHNIYVENDFLVTLEHVKDLGPGNLMFCGSMKGTMYYKKGSHADWEKSTIGVSISVDALVER